MLKAPPLIPGAYISRSTKIGPKIGVNMFKICSTKFEIPKKVDNTICPINVISKKLDQLQHRPYKSKVRQLHYITDKCRSEE